MSRVTVPGLLLRSYPYSETSRILRFLTPEYGIVSVVAKGVRRKSSKGEGAVDLFLEGELTFRYRPERDLHTLHDFRARPRHRGLGQDLARFAGASFLAELLLSHALQDENPRLYERTVEALRGLSSDPSEAVPGRILSGAWGILASFGFPPELDRCVRCGGGIAPDEPGIGRFDLAAGGLRCPRCGEEAAGPRVGPGARRDLRALLAGAPPVPLAGARAHVALVEGYALQHLAGARPFRSTALLHSVLGTLTDEKLDLPAGGRNN